MYKDSLYPEPDFKVMFFIMDKQFMRTIAVESEAENTYKGYSYKQDNTGWDVSPISCGKGFIQNATEYELTKDMNEAMLFASLKNPKA